ncbi:uncharacterized protein [Macaca nemestrina]|uniref:uncharacterized protein isoform X2 n=1 Tax=Macaca nemestrina TaxID=9545 RepID=UPI0039B855F2
MDVIFTSWLWRRRLHPPAPRNVAPSQSTTRDIRSTSRAWEDPPGPHGPGLPPLATSPVTPEAQGTVSILRPCPWLQIGGPRQRPGLSPQTGQEGALTWSPCLWLAVLAVS